MNIEQHMRDELRTRHEDAQQKILCARATIREAVDASLAVGALIEKTYRHKRGSTWRWLNDETGISADSAKSYKRAASVQSGRNIANDKVILQKLGILEQAPPRTTNGRATKAPPSVSTKVRKASSDIGKAIEKRPVASMTQDEKDLLVANMRPLAELYVALSTTTG